MKSKQYLLFIAFSLLAGFVGGFISNQLFSTKSAFAEKEPKTHKVIIAEEFRLVDKHGNSRGYFGLPTSMKSFEEEKLKKGLPPLQIAQLRIGPESGFNISLMAGAAGGILEISKPKSSSMYIEVNEDIPKLTGITLYNNKNDLLWSAP